MGLVQFDSSNVHQDCPQHQIEVLRLSPPEYRRVQVRMPGKRQRSRTNSLPTLYTSRGRLFRGFKAMSVYAFFEFFSFPICMTMLSNLCHSNLLTTVIGCPLIGIFSKRLLVSKGIVRARAT